jgi:hypothetical protein
MSQLIAQASASEVARTLGVLRKPVCPRPLSGARDRTGQDRPSAGVQGEAGEPAASGEQAAARAQEVAGGRHTDGRRGHGAGQGGGPGVAAAARGAARAPAHAALAPAQPQFPDAMPAHLRAVVARGARHRLEHGQQRCQALQHRRARAPRARRQLVLTARALWAGTCPGLHRAPSCGLAAALRPTLLPPAARRGPRAAQGRSLPGLLMRRRARRPRRRAQHVPPVPCGCRGRQLRLPQWLAGCAGGRGACPCCLVTPCPCCGAPAGTPQPAAADASGLSVPVTAAEAAILLPQHRLRSCHRSTACGLAPAAQAAG